MNEFFKIILFLSIGANLFLITYSFDVKNTPADSLLEEHANKWLKFPYLSKRIFAEKQNDILINFIPLRSALQDYIGKQDGKVGAYFEYLPSGTSIGVNDRDEVNLTSLSKVPMIMSIFKKIEREKMSIGDVLIIEKRHLNQRFGTLWKRGAGTKVSVEELIRLTLIESDNTAYNVLSEQLIGQEIDEVYNNLDISLSQKKESEQVYLRVSPKSYSSILRSLYLSSFLSKAHSNHILSLLTQTPFNNKIVAGVPDTVKVAHKIGVFEILDSKQNAFTDCGIVYVPNRPYILCVFVKDTDEQSQKHMAYLSKMIYEYISIVNPPK